MSYTTKIINKEWLIKIYGNHNGSRINTLVGLPGLIRYVGEEMADKLLTKAFESQTCKYNRKLRRGLQITFYAH